MADSKKTKLANKLIDSVMNELNPEGNILEDVDHSSLSGSKDDLLQGVLLNEPNHAEDLTASVLSENSGELQPQQEAATPTPKKNNFEESATLQLSQIAAKEKEPEVSIQSAASISDRTQPMIPVRSTSSPALRVNYGGAPRSQAKPQFSSPGQSSEAQFQQAESLLLAQNRILELEREVERIRQENELLTSAGSIARNRIDELTEMLHAVERSKTDSLEQVSIESKMLRESLLEKDRESTRLKKKIEELEQRLKTDLKKIRVRERELENRLELSRLEKTALLRSKDETILDLKRKVDLLMSELESYKQKSTELQDKIENQQDQMARTVRALRLALVNLDQSDSIPNSMPVPLKKAE